jgi:3-dehydroquinate synthetase
MAAAGRLAVRLGWTDAATVERQDALLQGIGLPTRFTGIEPREVADALRHDKKARGGRVPFILLRELGRAEVCHDVPTDAVVEVLRGMQG